MSDTLTYYAIMDDQATRDYPAGLVRRHEFADGGFVDEGLHRDLDWRRTPIIVEWERGESTDDLEEISQEEAERVIERFRERWGGSGA